MYILEPLLQENVNDGTTKFTKVQTPHCSTRYLGVHVHAFFVTYSITTSDRVPTWQWRSLPCLGFSLLDTVAGMMATEIATN